MVKVGIVGGTGYTGVELLRLLIRHPEVEIAAITSRSEAGTPVHEMFPNLRGFCDLEFSSPDVETLAGCDVVFYATPHGVAQSQAGELLTRGVKLIDLSADFRIRDIEVWEKWYGRTHGAPEWVEKGVYGLPEFNRDKIRHAQLIACPGCYPTSVQLGLLPLLESGAIDSSDLIANSASGVSGAGRGAAVPMLMAEVSDSYKAYGASGHRHLPEIQQGLADIAGGPVGLTFVPHLLPMVRGIHTTLYATLSDPELDVQSLYEQRYAEEPFVDVLPKGGHPETRTVRGTNLCRIAIHRQPNSSKVIVLAAIDNLTKGASGQAIQCLNIMFGWPETLGLNAPALLP